MNRAEATTIAVLGDTHDAAVDREQLLDVVLPWLDGASMILHTGDVSTGALLDRLEEVAPVTAVRSETDPELPPRLVDGPRRVTLDGYRVELVRVLAEEPVPRDDVDLVVHGATHAPKVVTADATLYINPGSVVFTPTPTMALVHIQAGRARVELIQLPAVSS